MVEAIRENWTIVITGRWNVAIFNPAWLGKNVFQSDEIMLEVGIEPGLPRRLTGDNVVVIPTNSRLMLAPSDLEEGTLLRMEQVAYKILSLLQHTPVNALGINYGYKISPLTQELRDKLPVLLSTELGREGLVMRSREYKWTVQYENRTLNINCKSDGDEANILFNFHLDVTDTEVAAENINGKIIPYRDKTRSILEQVFDITLED